MLDLKMQRIKETPDPSTNKLDGYLRQEKHIV